MSDYYAWRGRSWVSPEEQRDRAILTATRNAPTWVLRKINADRRASGEAELREAQFAKLQRPAQVLELGLGTICGVASYGLSTPTVCDWDKRKLPEMFSPTAFSSSVAEIRRGLSSVWLSKNHTTDELATTTDGSLVVRVDPKYGLEFYATLHNTPEHREVARLARSGKLAVSVGFVDPDFESVPARAGGRIRVIRKATLHHVALLDTTQRAPAYRASKVVHTWGRNSNAIRRALARARLSSYSARVSARLDT